MSEKKQEDFTYNEVVDIDTYFKRMVPQDTAPGVWRWEDVVHVMDEMEKNPKRYPSYRRAVCLVNNSWEGAPGTSPTIFTGYQRIRPGDSLPMHRHNSVAIYCWVSGTGLAVVEGVEIPIKKGDVITCPAWQAHGFTNTGDDDLIMFAVHDLPVLAQMRALFWEEPIGQENIQHVIKKVSASWSAKETEDDVANLESIVVKTQA